MNVPKAEVIIAQTATPVSFDLETLERVEDVTGKTIAQIIEFFRSLQAGGEKLTPKSAEAIALRFKVGLAAKFVSGSTGVPLNMIPLKDVLPAFSALAGPLVEAWQQLHAETDGPKAVAGASADSVPGPASTLESEPASSAASARANSET